MTLVEITVVMTIISILIVTAVPIFRETLEQSRVDVASSNLQAVWTAQRLYWAQYRKFSENLKLLEQNNLLDPGFISRNNKNGSPFYYDITKAGDNDFEARATRQNSSWNGEIEVDEKGIISGATQGVDGAVVTPSGI